VQNSPRVYYLTWLKNDFKRILTKKESQK